MRISATGKAEAGFTLVELLIVLTLIGLLSASVMLAIPTRDNLRSEAERFAALAEAARDKAVLDARPVSLRVGTDGYAFEERRRGEWVKLGRKPFDARKWDEGTSLAGEQDRLLFDPTGLAEPATFVLTRKDERLRVTVAADGGIAIDG